MAVLCILGHHPSCFHALEEDPHSVLWEEIVDTFLVDHTEPGFRMEVVVDLATCCYCNQPEVASENAVQVAHYTLLAETVDHHMEILVENHRMEAVHHYQSSFAAWLKLEPPFSPRLKQNSARNHHCESGLTATATESVSYWVQSKFSLHHHFWG